MSIPPRMNTDPEAELIESSYGSKEYTEYDNSRPHTDAAVLMLPCYNYQIDRPYKGCPDRWIRFNLCLAFRDSLSHVYAFLDVADFQKFRVPPLIVTLEMADTSEPTHFRGIEIKVESSQKTELHFYRKLSGYNAVKFNYRLMCSKAPEPFPNAQTMIDLMNPLSGLVIELGIKPENFGVETGRFALRSTEGTMFYPHCVIMQQYSVEMKRFLDGNLYGIRDGAPLCLPCSSAALDYLLQIIYLQKIDQKFVGYLSETLEVAHLWQMNKIVELCHEQMRHSVKHQLNKDFDSLRQWFVVAAKFEVKCEGNQLLESEILSQLMRLTGKDEKKKTIVEAQVADAEYIKEKSLEKVSALSVKFNQMK